MGWRSGRFSGNGMHVAVRGRERKLEEEEGNGKEVGFGVAIFGDFKLSITHWRSGYGKVENYGDVGLA